MRARHLQALVAITVAGAVIRFATLGVQSFWLVAAALCAFNPLLVWYSQEARSYALLVLLSGLSLLAMIAVLDRPDARRVATWAAVAVVALATHYFAGFLLAAEALWLLWRVDQ